MWGLFGVVWDSGRVLAELMSRYDVSGLRVLEVGCGIGLPSLVLNARGADITAMDHAPGAEAFLAYNVALNDDEPIPFTRGPMSDAAMDLGEFDLIIGSDVLYERGSAEVLCAFLGRHAAASAVVILVGPGRGSLGKYTKGMDALGFTSTRELVPIGEGDQLGRIVTSVRTAS